MKAQHVFIFNGVGDGVGVQLLLKYVLGGFIGFALVLPHFVGGVFVEDGGAGEAKELGVRKKLLDGFVVFAKLGAVAFVENKDDARSEERRVGKECISEMSLY